MHKRARLKSGEEVMLTEKLIEWNNDQEYYRVQREDGSINIIVGFRNSSINRS